MSLDTRGYDPQRLLPQSLEDRLLGLLGRLGGSALFALVAVLWLCLATWSVVDPSLTHATANEPTNVLGRLGAIISDLLLQTLGFAAALALVAPLVWSVELLRSERVVSGRLKLGFFPLAVLACAGALSSLPIAANWPLNHGYGGVLGDGVFSVVNRLFAMINQERAGFASGLVLLSVAFAMSGKALGFDAEELLRLAMRSWRDWARYLRAVRGERKAAADERDDYSISNWTSEPRGPLSPTPAAGQTDARVLEPMLPMPRDLSVGSEVRFTPESVWPVLPIQSSPDRGHRDQFGPAVARSAHDTSPGFAPAFGPPEFVPPAPPVVPDDTIADRGAGFDYSTDMASRKIARRFAPASTQIQNQDAPAMPEVDLPPPPISPMPPAAAKGKGLFGYAGGRPPPPPAWKRPSLDFLRRPTGAKGGAELSQTVMRGNARLLEDVLADFGVKGEVKDIRPGPVVTLYELEPSRGTKSSRVIGLADDIARSMSVASIRAAVVPGRNAIGLELPNARRDAVLLREILEADVYRSSDAALPLALGKTIGGDPVVADLARMPHLLVAGTTGSGKSVGVNAMVLSLLYRHSPDDCRLLMIDPKMLELSVYNGIPHLLTPVVTDPAKAVAALNWAVSEMEERYKRMAALSVRNIDVFNNRVRNARKRGEMLSRTVQTGFDKLGQAVFETQKMDLEPLPHIVIVVDEFADLMIVAGKEVETAVQRLAQMARAAGIHLIMATQRPSVDIITGTIKANFPTRISFKVTSKIDSRTIINEQGAEQLLGQGDMLYSSGAGQITRVHGAFVSDEEVETIADALRRQGTPKYVEGICDAPQRPVSAGVERATGEDDLYDRAVAILVTDRKASTSYLQRRLGIGYNRAADLIERMERDGLISAANHVGKREILRDPGTSDAA